MVFEKGNYVWIKDKWYQVILADEQYACLGEFKKYDVEVEEGLVRTITSFEEVRIYSNREEFKKNIEGLGDII